MLTDRLMAIASQIEKGDVVADIGSDHAYIPIYLMNEGIASKLIVSDISKDALKISRQHCAEMAPKAKFDFRQGNGLKVLRNEKVDAVIIAGMGGLTIKNILAKNLTKAKSVGKLILQPRSAQGELRHWLIRKGFTIEKELLAEEGRFICEIIVAKAGQVPDQYKLEYEPTAIQWEIPPWLKDINSPLFDSLVERKLEREKRILQSMDNSKCISDEDKQAIRNNIAYLEGLL